MKFKKWISIVLALLMCFSFAACHKKDKGEPPADQTPQTPSTSEREDPSFSEIDDTDYYFVEEGKSDFIIVVPEKADSNEEKAASELNFFLSEALDVTLPIVKDVTVDFDDSQKRISIGRTTLFNESGIDADNSVLKTSGYGMVTQENTLYLYGSNLISDYGVVYAVYGFLAEMIDLKIYAGDCYTYSSPAKLKMKSFDVLEIPHYDRRVVSTPRLTNDPIYKMRLRNYGGYIRTEGSVHSHLFYLPASKYLADHPDWYTADGKELRLINTEMQAAFIEAVKEHIRNNPRVEEIFIGIEDRHEPLTDADAAEAKRLYNTGQSGLNVVFCNNVVEAIEEWLLTEFPGREMSYRSFIYFEDTTPPVTWDETAQKYIPDSEWVIPHEKLAMEIAYMAMPDWGDTLFSESNKSMLNVIQGWASICNNFSVYGYGTNYHGYIIPFVGFQGWEANTRYGYEMGFNGYYNLLGSNSASPGLEELAIYVQSEMLWDTSLHYEDLAREFIFAYYGDAAEQVWEYFTLMTTRLAIADIESKMTQGHTTGFPWDAKNWPFEFIQKCSEVLESGEAALLPLKDSNPELYDVMLNRIRQQKVTIQYLQMRHYAMYYNKAQIAKMCDEMEETCMRNGFVRVEEKDAYNSIVTSIRQWRLEYL